MCELPPLSLSSSSSLSCKACASDNMLLPCTAVAVIAAFVAAVPPALFVLVPVTKKCCKLSARLRVLHKVLKRERLGEQQQMQLQQN